MSIVGRTAIAPCGHTGEVIIGTYVKCSQGCEGPPVVPMRGEVGHVENCACKPCQIRRKAHTVVLRTDKGEELVRVPWNGTDNVLKAVSPKEAQVRHYQFLDADGKIIAKGNTSAFVADGDIKIHVKLMMDALVACAVAKGGVTQRIDPTKVTITFNGQQLQGAWTFAPITIP